MEDFYMVLPSSACQNIYPNNKANKFTISWQEPIEGNNWSVALTELCYNYVPKSVGTQHGIRYGIMRKLSFSYLFDLEISNNVKLDRYGGVDFPEPKHPPYDDWKELMVDVANGKLSITANHDFTLDFGSEEAAKQCGFDTQIVNVKGPPYSIQAPEALPKKKKKLIVKNIKVTYFSKNYVDERLFQFDNNYWWPDVKDMIIAISLMLVDAFKTFEINTDGMLALTLHNKVRYVEFLNGFNIILGFGNDTRLENNVMYDSSTTPSQSFQGQSIPKTNSGLSNMNIFTSLIKPIRVGSEMLPLLKNISIKNNESENCTVRHVDVKNPLYLPISTNRLNTIEFDIRTDGNDPFPFCKGAVNTLTLHFRYKHE
jgi:hypothetical protein